MIPGPRPPKGHDRPTAGRDRGLEVVRSAQPGLLQEATDMSLAHDDAAPAEGSSADLPSVTLARTSRGWSVVSPAGTASADDLVEGLTLADLIAEEFGASWNPTAPPAARHGARAQAAEPPRTPRGPDRRPRADRRAAGARARGRVSTERAIGVLAERNGPTPARRSSRCAAGPLLRSPRGRARP